MSATGSLTRLAAEVRSQRRLFVEVVLTQTCTYLLSAVAAVLSVGVVAQVVTGSGRVGQALLGLTVVVLAGAVVSWTDSWVAHVLAYRVVDQVRAGIYEALARLAPHGLGHRRSGETASTAMADVESLEWFYAHTLATMVGAVVSTALLDLALLIWWGPVALVALVAQLLVVAVPLAAAGLARRQGADLRREVAALSADVVDLRQSARDLVLLGRADERVRRVTAGSDRIQRVRRAIAVRSGVESAAIEALVATTMVLSVIVLLATDAPPGDIPVGVVLAGSAVSPAVVLAGALARLGEMRAAADRVVEVLTAPSSSRAAGTRTTLDQVEGQQGSVQLRGLSLGYGDSPDIVSDTDLDIAPGEHVALVGPSGAGKTTLAHGLARLIDPRSGSLLIDGVDVADETPTTTRRRVVLVEQRPHVFRQSLRDNVTLGASASDDDVVAALAAAGLGEFVQAREGGLDAIVAEHGADWSGGQRQRLGLARGLLADPSVLILDEPTAHLDPATEEAFLASLSAVRQGQTTLVVSHRPSTIAWCDRVVYLVDGSVRADGTHAELLAREPGYRAALAEVSETEGTQRTSLGDSPRLTNADEGCPAGNH